MKIKYINSMGGESTHVFERNIMSDFVSHTVVEKGVVVEERALNAVELLKQIKFLLQDRDVLIS